ncbi:MAG: sterol desaturase family protein [Candidatus Omnitrophica bacterium]|nr:sterol desaturase family protein [Candidatus Omnitrophota bacterium]
MDRPNRLLHIARNAAIGLVNAAALTLFFSGLIASSARWGQMGSLGLLHRLPLPPSWHAAAGFLLFDLWMYGWHRANHALPWLWRFHRVHHSDDAVDASSAYRFHLGEMLISTLLRLAVIPLIGISLRQLVFYELILQPVILFHHSNINLPETLDRWMRSLVVSPNMHRVHHSDIPDETNSNYASIFSFWDRLWGSYRRRELLTIRYGLKEFREPRWQTFRGMLSNPLV